MGTGARIDEAVASITHVRKGFAEEQLNRLIRSAPSYIRLLGIIGDASVALAKGELQNALRFDDPTREQKAQAQYGLALAAMWEGNPAAAVAAVHALARLGAVGRDYVRLLLAESDVPPAVREICARGARETDEQVL